MKYSKDVGINWHLRFRQKIDRLTKEVEVLQARLNIAHRKLKKYENNNTRTTRYRKNNNVIKFSR
jgi:hypothetical protein